MSEQVKNNQQTVVIALVAIAVLLAAIVGVIIYQQSQTAALPQISQQAGAPGSTPMGEQGGMPGGMPGGAPKAEFDPATATKVPAGTEPEAFVRSYYELCAAKDYEQAFTMLPKATQEYYGDAAKFKSTLEGYGISGFEIQSTTGDDKEMQVVGVQQAQGMAFAYTWTLVKEGDTWLVKSREMGAAE